MTCGFTLQEGSLPRNVDPIVCDGEAWKDGKCIWHVDSDLKSAEDLRSEADTRDRVDGAKLGGIEFDERANISDTTLYSPQFEGATLRRADFRGVKIVGGQFSNANLSNAVFSPYSEGDETTPAKVTESDFTEATMRGTEFHEANLSKSDFSDSNINSAEFDKSNLKESVFHGVEAKESQFDHANLRSADFRDADLSGANLVGAHLREADFREANIHGANFEAARLRNTSLRDAYANSETNFGPKHVYEFVDDLCCSRHRLNLNSEFDTKSLTPIDNQQYSLLDEKHPLTVYEQPPRPRGYLIPAIERIITRFPLTKSPSGSREYWLEESLIAYREIQRLFEDNLETEEKRQFAVREKEVKRKIAYREGKLSWLRLSVQRWTMLYGESPLRVLLVSLVVILCSSSIFAVSGVTPVSSDVIISVFSSQSVPRLVEASLTTGATKFFTPSNVYYEPTGIGRIVGTTEMIVGALLTAMFVFTLGRRATE